MPDRDDILHPNSTATTIVRFVFVLLGTLLGTVAGVFLFVWVPSGTSVFGVLLAVITTLLGARIAGGLTTTVLPTYNVAEVAVTGPITRDGDFGPVPGQGRSIPADDIVEQIERAEADRNADALLVKLNTPGGEVVPSEDIRNAVVSFEGPTIAYATDTCASGGYWIASACDEIWARETSVIGSIGVIGSRLNASTLAEELGLSYERFAAGRYKDAGTALKEIDDDERAYLQGLIDDYYEHFVERVADGRDIDPDAIRDTEARVYLGNDAQDIDLIDAIGTHEDVLDRVTELLDTEAVHTEFEPERSVRQRLQRGARGLAFAFGAGVWSHIDERFDVRL
ncbi:signal peptide peptidase SppA [Halocatena salina]|uniref:Signal peptide peptidase SppA n=1 Tax=Halocatena salina TaxID=2934340 RepID=A0A8T9ZZ53_9EURY|nr:signal peptide peptidase SppA [Halocatena salina]UPM42040.1 signal peptide peptidase SppA [Halocatena salina]